MKIKSREKPGKQILIKSSTDIASIYKSLTFPGRISGRRVRSITYTAWMRKMWKSYKLKMLLVFIIKHLICGDHDKIPVKPELAKQPLETLNAGHNYVLTPASSSRILPCILCD